MKVLLVGNYPADGQWSMDRFCNMLSRGLTAEGVENEVVRPPVVLGGRNKWLGYADKFVLFPVALRRAVKARRGWIVHILDQGNGIYAGCAPGCVVTCHDLLAIRAARGEFPAQRTSGSGRIFQRMILRGLRQAGGIVCVSRATGNDAERLIGESEVIPNGIEDFWGPMDAEEAWHLLEKAGVCPGARTTEYVLNIGGEQWYKNRAQTVRTFIELRARGHTPKLVMVGPDLDAALVAKVKEAGLVGEVIVLKEVPDEALRALYAMAAVLLFPSLAEGFGWPILEAQACGCPVVATNKDPTMAVAQVLEMDEARRAALVAGGMENARRFTVEKMARGYIEFYARSRK
jgi:glycosyltransferase involved in cell wall biosynthesis